MALAIVMCYRESTDCKGSQEAKFYSSSKLLRLGIIKLNVDIVQVGRDGYDWGVVKASLGVIALRGLKHGTGFQGVHLRS